MVKLGSWKGREKNGIAQDQDKDAVMLLLIIQLQADNFSDVCRQNSKRAGAMPGPAKQPKCSS